MADRKDRLIELKVLNKKKLFLNQFPIKTLSIDSFVDPEITIKLLNDTYKVVDSKNPEIINFGTKDLFEMVKNTNKQMMNHFHEDAILFHDQSELGALRLKVEQFYEHIQDILHYFIVVKSEDLILVDEKLLFGLFIFRHEYNYEFCVWS